MVFYVSDVKYPITFQNCGNLICEDGFLHTRRRLNCYVLIFVQAGTLYIQQGSTNYEVSENQFILLRPEFTHYGYQSSSGYLSYYWAHFAFTDPDLKVYTQNTLKNLPDFNPEIAFNPDSPQIKPKEIYFIPEYGTLPAEKRSTLLFAQLLDIYKRGNYAVPYQCDYALNLFLLQFSQEMLTLWGKDFTPPDAIENIIEWIRRHYSEPISVQLIAEKFNYNPDYLSTLFKKYTGYSLLMYINIMRINIAKELLTSTDDCIYEISEKCGFSDSKYFLRLFKKYVGVTPGNYRKTFHLKYINIK